MLRIALLVYSVLYTVAFCLYLPYYLWRIRFRERSGVDLGQRMGRLPECLRKPRHPALPAVWLHAVSVGEVNAARPLAERLIEGTAQAQKAQSLFVTTTTDTGQNLARRIFKGRAKVFYFPVDWQWTCRRFLKRLRPSVVLLTETELWPGFLFSARRSKIPVVLVNGRFSDHSFRRYRRLRWLMRPLLAGVDHFCMQSIEDKKRILELGAPKDRVHWTGNLKFDYQLDPDVQREQLAQRINALMKRERDNPLWICGSTREGEEELLADCLLQLRQRFAGLRMVLAPRHPHRGPEVQKLLRSRGLGCLLRSEWSSESGLEADEPPDVFILDSIGELPYLYAVADLVYIGGSLVPKGGQNILEAAYFGKPILFGPHMENFREISRSFVKAYAALQVSSAEELTDRVGYLLGDSDAAAWLGRNARKVMRQSRGAVERTLELVGPYLG